MPNDFKKFKFLSSLVECEHVSEQQAIALTDDQAEILNIKNIFDLVFAGECSIEKFITLSHGQLAILKLLSENDSFLSVTFPLKNLIQQLLEQSLEQVEILDKNYMLIVYLLKKKILTIEQLIKLNEDQLESKKLAITDILTAEDIPIDKKLQADLEKSAETCDLKLLEECLSKVEFKSIAVNSRNSRRESLLMLAAGSRKSDAESLSFVKFLVFAGAVVMVQSNDLRTALMCAAQRGHVSVIRFLAQRVSRSHFLLEDDIGQTAAKYYEKATGSKWDIQLPPQEIPSATIAAVVTLGGSPVHTQSAVDVKDVKTTPAVSVLRKKG